MKASYDVKACYVGTGYICFFKIDNQLNFDERGTYGTGCKIYPTKEKAEAAGKRYLRKMKNNGFEI